MSWPVVCGSGRRTTHTTATLSTLTALQVPVGDSCPNVGVISVTYGDQTDVISYTDTGGDSGDHTNTGADSDASLARKITQKP